MIVGDALQKLFTEKKIAPIECFDSTCIVLSLGAIVKKLVPTQDCKLLEYGKTPPKECIHTMDISATGLELAPHSSVLAFQRWPN